MAEGVNVRFSGTLKRFVEQRSGDGGLYSSSSEYIRDLVRRDYEREEKLRWDALHSELKSAMEAPVASYLPLDGPSILAEARNRATQG